MTQMSGAPFNSTAPSAPELFGVAQIELGSELFIINSVAGSLLVIQGIDVVGTSSGSGPTDVDASIGPEGVGIWHDTLGSSIDDLTWRGALPLKLTRTVTITVVGPQIVWATVWGYRTTDSGFSV